MAASTRNGKSTPFGTPRCGACRHNLTGATTSSACPNCGRPLVEVLVRDGAATNSYRWQAKATVLGRPAVAIAFGPSGDEVRGRARGWIAIGDDAVGVVAVGGVARGVVAIGGVAIGAVTAGGLSLGLLVGVGGLATAPLGLAIGGCAIGLLAVGGFSIGFAAVGGMAIAWFPAGGGQVGVHPLRGPHGSSASAEAVAFWATLRPIVGDVARGSFSQLIPVMIAALAHLVALVALSLPAFLAWWRYDREEERDRIRRGVP